MPSPRDTEFRVQLSPVPTHTTFGLVGSSAMAPMDCTGSRSNTGLNVVPPSSDFHTPPEAAPTNSVTLPSASCRPATAAIRPLIVAEPMLRMPRPEIVALSTACADVAKPAKEDAAISARRVLRKLAPYFGCGAALGCAGIWKMAESTGTFASADLMVITCLSEGAEFRGPDVIENGK